MLVSVFTPTYNRGHLIERLYRSLCKQTSADFEWIIVDDGSSDDTEKVVRAFLEEHKIPIRYIKQANGGKHRAINAGVREARGTLFFIVDSDDLLTDDAIEQIRNHYLPIADDPTFCGICGLKAYFDGAKVGGEESWETIDCSTLEARMKYGIKGDMAEVFRTDVLRRFPFPEIDGERFCPEALVWNRIAQRYKMRYFYRKIYLCEYLPDGLTARIIRIRMESPIASATYYSELLRYDIPFSQKIKAAINFWRFALCRSDFSLRKAVRRAGISASAALPIGALLHLKDKRRS